MSLFSGDSSAVPALAEARRRRWWWTIGFLATLSLLLLVSRPAYRAGKHWRGRMLAAEAEKMIAAKKWPEASSKAQAAFQLAPAEPAVQRAIAQLYTAAGSPLALRFWKSLVAQPAATDADRVEAAQMALQLQQLDFAQDQINLLLQREPVAGPALLLAAQLALLRSDRPTALAYLARLLTQDPANAPATLLRAQVLFASPEAAAQHAGQQALQEIAAGGDPAAISALVTLAAAPNISPAELQAVANALELKSPAVEHQLLVAALRLRSAPDQKTAIVDQAVARFQNQGPEARLALARWLLQQGEPERVLTLIPPAAALSDRDLFLVHIDALATLSRWPEIQQILEKGHAPIDSFYAEIFLARAARELHDDRGEELHWSRAFLAARLKPPLLLYLAQYAGKVRAINIAEKTWRELAHNPTYTLRADLALLPIVSAQGNTRVLRDLLREIARLSPAEPAPQNDAAYLDLLLGENIAAARQTAERLVQEHPEFLAYRATLALADLRSGNPSAAAQCFARIDLPWNQWPSGAQAVRMATLFANGQTDEAQQLLKEIRPEALKPEERALLEPTRQ